MERTKSEIGAWLDAFRSAPDFLDRYPFYASILGRMDPVADPSVKRMAVSLHGGRFYLHINVDAFMTEPQHLIGVLLHEVHHVVLGHLSHPKFASAREPELMDLAIEMSANEYIEEPLPDPITFQHYSALGLRAGQSTIERYHRLVEAMQGGKLGKDGASPQPSPSPDRRAPGGGERADDHRYLRRPERDPGAIEQTRQLIARAMEESESIRPGSGEEVPSRLVAGRSPASLLEELTGALGAPAAFLEWKTALRMFVARARAPVHTYARPNRRFPGRVGEVPGRTYSPRVIVRPSLLVAIDTSMSVTQAELFEVARQLARLSEHAQITVAECDAEIARVYPFTGLLTDVKGRGGTDLRPVFEDAFLRSRRVDGVIYFTDGDGPTRETAPDLPVLWVLTKPTEFACAWGERAWLSPSSEAPRPRQAKARR
jgi:predicted metal-dependent peptidase